MTVRKSPRGKWMIDVKIRRPNGETVRIRRVSPVQTKRGAQRHERELRELVARGDWRPDAPSNEPKPEPVPTLEQWAEIFAVEHSEAKQLRPATVEFHRQVFRDHLIPRFGSLRMNQIGTPHFDRLRAASTKAGLAPKTINNILGVLSGALRFYYHRRGEAPPHFDTCRVRVPRTPVKFWEPTEYTRIVDAATELGPWELAIVLLLGDAGMRRGEVVGLEWNHLQRGDRPAIVVQRAYSRGHFGPPKGGRPRTIPMTTRLARALAELPRTLGVPWVVTREGEQGITHADTHTIARAVGRVETAAGLGNGRDGRCHRLRHTYVTSLAAAGVPARTIMELVGHQDLATVLRYMHVARGATDDAIAKLQAYNQGHHRGTAQGADRKTSS